jgi:hypothetical protein
LLDNSIRHELVEIDLDFTSMLWSFQRVGRRDLLGAEVRLLPNGMIDGYSHPNERTWNYGPQPATIEFRNGSNQVTTFFHTLKTTSAGAMQFTGTFTLAPITHVLEESAPGWHFDSNYVSWLQFDHQ